MPGHFEAVFSIAFSRDGSMLASGSSDKTIKIHETKGGTIRKHLRGHRDDVLCVKYHPTDPNMLGSGKMI